MLLRHAWLSRLLKPPTIVEEEEEEEDDAVDPGSVEDGNDSSNSRVLDKEVSDWVLIAMEKRKNGTMGKRAKPALHAAPLDAVPSPTAAIAHA